jgi:gamma-glutamyltranspeptidase/glutathione hydrolase
MKRAYADRAEYLGDPDFVKIPVEQLVSKSYAKNLASKIGEHATESKEISARSNRTPNESKETTHYSVVDSCGNAVSVTTTINSGYGAKVVVEGAGFLLNNEMDDFSAKPGVPNQFGLIGGTANAIEGNKRMLSSMTPTIVLKDGKPIVVLGSPGGSTIITTVLQVISNIIDFNMSLREALDAPRLHHQLLPDFIEFENGAMSHTVSADLIKRGHIFGSKHSLGLVEAVFIDSNNSFWGATDSRGSGLAEGF